MNSSTSIDKIVNEAYDRGYSDAQQDLTRCCDCIHYRDDGACRFVTFHVTPADFCSKAYMKTQFHKLE